MGQVERTYHWQDSILSGIQRGLHLLDGTAFKNACIRPNPGATIQAMALTPQEKKQSAGMMRVNHVGEVCAQALYLGQSFTARQMKLTIAFHQAAEEEADHLRWCEERLMELNSHKSYLNSLWFTGSLLIGTCAGLAGDRWSLGFLAETEKQVIAHLTKHLAKISPNDQKSRMIIEQMRIDETKHATTAILLGGRELPYSIKCIMRVTAKMMTSLAYYV